MAKARFGMGPCTARSMPFWCVGNPLSDPFGGAVLERIDSIKVAEIICWAAEQNLIEATSFHDDDLVPWDMANPEDDVDRNSTAYATLQKIKGMLRRSKLFVNTATCSLHGSSIFRNGGLANPDARIRDLARLKVERTIRIGNMLGARYLTYWVARDGFEVAVKVPWKNVFDWLAAALDHSYDYIKQNKFTNYVGGTIEPKPNEPRGFMYLPSSGHAVGFILGKLKNPEFWGVNPELLQHESMTLLNAVNTIAFLVSTKKLSFLHFGNQIKGQFDNDFPPLIGPEGLKETVQMFYALNQLGWKGTVEFDCHMLRAEGGLNDPIGCRKQFVENCCTALTMALELASRLEGKWAANLEQSQADLAGIVRMCNLDQKKVARITRRG